MASNSELKLNHFLRLRISKDERAVLDVMAERENVTDSQFIRLLIRQAAGLPIPVAEASREHLSSNAEQLRKAGVNLNQAVRAMNEGRVGYEEALANALQKLGSAVIEQQKTINQMLRSSRKRRQSP